MMLEKINFRSLRIISLIVVALVISACSSKQVNEPKVLDPEFSDRIVFKRAWKESVGEGDLGLKLQLTPVMRDDKLYTIDAEGTLYVIDRFSGKEQRRLSLEEKVSSGLAIDRTNFYLSTFDGELIAVNILSGEEVWRAKLTSEAVAAPVVNGELVIVQTIDGKVAAFEASDGEQRWRYDSVGPVLSLRGTAEPLVSRRYTVTSFANGELFAFRNDTGQPLWKSTLALPKGRTELERLVDADGQPVLDGDTLYAVAYQGKLVALSAVDGQELWAKDVSSFNQLAHGFGQLFVTTADGEVIAYDKSSGKVLWQNDDFQYRRLSSPKIFDQFVLAADFEGYIHVLSVSDGATMARKYPDSDGVMGKMIVRGDMLYVYARSGDIVAYQLFPNEAVTSHRNNIRKKRRLEETSFEHRD
jgi:outer membrane protein assembly factor BamB